jgi:adenosine deaminase
MKPNQLTQAILDIIATTNGISLDDTLELATSDLGIDSKHRAEIKNFREMLSQYHREEIPLENLISHAVSDALLFFFKNFPLRYIEEHTHLTGALSADFLHPLVAEELASTHKNQILASLAKIYPQNKPWSNKDELAKAITLAPNELFDRYLDLLYLPKIILTSRERYAQSAYHLATTTWHEHNVGTLRCKFTLSRASGKAPNMLPCDLVNSEDVVLGLYDGFMRFKKEQPTFKFILSPSFRKEENFFNAENFRNKQEDFLAQVKELLNLLEKFPELSSCLTDVDTVGNERDLYRKEHFNVFRYGFRKLKFKGFYIRSHHGEVWHTLKRGVQAVDNALNIWHIDTLEHGLSLGINPNYYFHRMFQRVIEHNHQAQKIDPKSNEGKELQDMDFSQQPAILQKLLNGVPLKVQEEQYLVKIKFHMAREVEHYQHDVLNRIINKGISLVALPSSNNKLTTCFPDYKDHPFTWWEKKGVGLGVGTDNYITLDTNYLKELLILLFTDPQNLKITKLLMVATGENRRPFMSQLLWRMREKWCD